MPAPCSSLHLALGVQPKLAACLASAMILLTLDLSPTAYSVVLLYCRTCASDAMIRQGLKIKSSEAEGVLKLCSVNVPRRL